MIYRLGKTYVDKAARNHPEDQFLGWINVDGSGMGNTAGIRPLRFTSSLEQSGMPAYLVLVTHDRTGGQKNPWDDIVDYSNAEILYWGDARQHDIKRLDEFRGNAVLRRIYDYQLDGGTDMVAPILHFSKPDKGIVKFNGLCVLRELEISWFDDHGSPVRNYHAHMTILDCEEVDLGWLHARVKAESAGKIDSHSSCPVAWRKYKKGELRPIDIWSAKIRSKEDQLPDIDSADQVIIDQLLALNPIEFERAIVAMFKGLTDVTHHISGTKPSADGGFDFFGRFRLPRPINYEIPFRGEVKRYARSTSVDPKSVSRLVARLNRQEYGIFVTTSYFTAAAQREVLSDQYPVHLISGSDLVLMLKYLKLCSDGHLNPEWIATIIN
jgi:hypothetical protein